MSELVRMRVRGEKRRSCGETKCNCKLHEEHGWSGYCRSVHGNVLLPLKNTQMVAKIILGYGGVSNKYRHPLCGKLQEKQLQSNEPYQVQVTAGNGPCWGFLSGWWCIHKGATFHIWLGAETEWEARVIIPHPGGNHKDCTVCSKRNVLGGRRESTYIFEMYDCKPGPCGNIFKR